MRWSASLRSAKGWIPETPGERVGVEGGVQRRVGVEGGVQRGVAGEQSRARTHRRGSSVAVQKADVVPAVIVVVGVVVVDGEDPGSHHEGQGQQEEKGGAHGCRCGADQASRTRPT
jgi:hypothetical protein